MALFKCKMCGGALEINNNETVVTCEYCGTQQTLPKLDDDKRVNLYDRANHFRRNNEFDKAMGIYEQILNEDNTDAEAYWSLVLCRYGIEYVEDPSSHKRLSTVNRAQFTSVFDDDNYKSALEYADSYQKSIYEAEAKAINEIQKGILAISQKEDPFDVFICYKETDNNGRRTPDSVLAQDLYYQLKQEGFKVFFSRITLEDKLGSAYEPYIFAALNSSKVMVTLGTKPEYFNAVWVKNEWSRYLSLIKQGQKKILIPAYKDMDPYDLPEEFSHLQAQDMSKLGFMQDLIRGIKKIVQADAPKATVVKETVISGGNANTASLLKRAFMFLEDGDFDRADEFCEQVLNLDPECAEAYLGKLMAELRVRKQEALKDQAEPFNSNNNYQKVLRFGSEKQKAGLIACIEQINTRNENARMEGIYQKATSTMAEAESEEEYKEAAELYDSIPDYKDASNLAKECLEKAEIARKDAVYNAACVVLSDTHNWTGKDTDIKAYEEAIIKFESISSWKDADQMILACQKKIEEIKVREEAERIEAEAKRIEAERITKIAVITGLAVVVALIIVFAYIVPSNKYDIAINHLNNGDIEHACVIFKELGSFKDSKELLKEQQKLAFEEADVLAAQGKYKDAYNKLKTAQCDENTDKVVAYKNISEGKWKEGIELFNIQTFVIPEGTTVISSEKFKDCKTLKSVIIPEGVTKIQSYAFFCCENLQSISLPNSLIQIDQKAFMHCYDLQEINLPDNVKVIEDNAFLGCSSLLKITFSENLQSIGESAFRHCKALKEVSFPNKLQRIGQHAFANCDNLEKVVISDSVIDIEYWAFADNLKLSYIKFGNDMKKIEIGTCEGCENLKTVVFGNKIEEIHVSAFEGCKSLANLTLPSSLTDISTEAFKDCTALTSVTIPNSVDSLGKNVFGGCTNLKSVTFENPYNWKVDYNYPDISNPTRNVTYLTKTYADEYWYRK